MLSSTQVLKKAADKAGFKRVRYEDSKIPTSLSNICILVCFGDMRSTFVLSSILARRIREEVKGSKYFIICSWPGQAGLFPYCDEYWELNTDILKDVNDIRTIYNDAVGLKNNNEIIISLIRILNSFFEDVVDYSIFEPYYDQGLKIGFFDRFKHVKKYLPSVPSTNILGDEINRRLAHPKCVFLYPSIYLQSWREGRVQHNLCNKSFWVALIERLLTEGYQPVLYHDKFTYDLSPDFVNKCIYLANLDVLSLLSAMRGAGRVLDLWTGISRYALAARCPFVCCEERILYNNLKDYEIDDLCESSLFKSYLYVFPSISSEDNKNLWNLNIFDGIITKLSLLDDKVLPSPLEQYEVSLYNQVRIIKNKKMGIHYIKIPKY